MCPCRIREADAPLTSVLGLIYTATRSIIVLTRAYIVGVVRRRVVRRHSRPLLFEACPYRELERRSKRRRKKPDQNYSTDCLLLAGGAGQEESLFGCAKLEPAYATVCKRFLTSLPP
jgi:hypothetical protein